MPRRDKRILEEPSCRVCGCTQENGCSIGCSWVAGDLCSACEPYVAAGIKLQTSLSRNKHWDRPRRIEEIARVMRQTAEEVHGVP